MGERIEGGSEKWGAGQPCELPLDEVKALRAQMRAMREPIEDWCHRMNTSDDPESVAFRERWARTQSGRGEDASEEVAR